MLKRPVNILMAAILKKQYGKQINAKNIDQLSSFKIKKIFKGEDEKWKEIYLHNVIDEWYKNQEESMVTFGNLKKLIRKTKISINRIEKHNLFIIEERSFSVDRNIKLLEVSVPLYKKESVGVKFDNATLYKMKDGRLMTYTVGNLLLTNKRLIIDADNRVFFTWNSMKEPKFKKYGYEFTSDDKLYVIRIHDQVTLNETIKNFVSRKVKKWSH